MFYLLNYPFKMIATQFGIAVINSNVFGKETQLLAMIVSDISAICFMLPLLLTPIHSGQEQKMAFKQEHQTKAYIKVTFVFMFLFMILLFCLANGKDSFKTMLSVSLMKQRQVSLANMRIGSGFSALCSAGALICQYIIIWTCVFNWSRLEKIWKLLFSLFLLFIMWYTYVMEFSKQNTLFPLLLIIVFYNISSFYNANRKKLSLFKLAFLGVLGLFLVAFIGFMRSFTSIATVKDLFFSMYQQFFNAFDAPDNLTAILSRMNNIWVGDLGFKPLFLNSLIVFIPRSIWRGKPLLQGQMYIMSFYLQERFTGPLGESISSSIPGELITSGGIITMIILSLFMGMFYAYLYKNISNNKNSMFHQIAYAYAVIQLNAFCRSGTATINGIIFFIICAKIITTFHKLFLNTLIRLKSPEIRLAIARKEENTHVCNKCDIRL